MSGDKAPQSEPFSMAGCRHCCTLLFSSSEEHYAKLRENIWGVGSTEALLLVQGVKGLSEDALSQSLNHVLF